MSQNYTGETPQPHPSSDNKDAARELLPAYSIGATDEAETALVEAFLSDGEIAAELAEYQRLGDALLHSAPPAKPPADLHVRLMASLHEETTPPQPKPIPQKGVSRLWAGLAAAIVLLVLSNILWLTQLSTVTRERSELALQVEELTTLIQAITRQNSPRLELAARTEFLPEETEAEVTWAQVGEQQLWVALFYAENLPTLEAGQVYQLWLARDNVPYSFGFVQVDEEGRATLIFTTTEPVSSYDFIGITAEPEGGSPAPSSEPLIFGTFES